MLCSCEQKADWSANLLHKRQPRGAPYQRRYAIFTNDGAKGHGVVIEGNDWRWCAKCCRQMPDAMRKGSS